MEVKKKSIITDLSNVSDHEIKRPDSLKNIILRHANSDNETVGGRDGGRMYLFVILMIRGVME